MDSFLTVKELKQYLNNFNDDAYVALEDDYYNTDILYSSALGFGGEDLFIINTSRSEMGYKFDKESEDNSDDFFEDEPFDSDEDDYS